MISKELLGEVLPTYKGFELFIDENEIIFSKDGEMYSDINIYELAHKCKEWANTLDMVKLQNNYQITSKQDWIGGVVCAKAWILDINDDLSYTSEMCISEPEAIFKACEWVLNEKD